MHIRISVENQLQIRTASGAWQNVRRKIPILLTEHGGEVTVAGAGRPMHCTPVEAIVLASYGVALKIETGDVFTVKEIG